MARRKRILDPVAAANVLRAPDVVAHGQQSAARSSPFGSSQMTMGMSAGRV